MIALAEKNEDRTFYQDPIMVGILHPDGMSRFVSIFEFKDRTLIRMDFRGQMKHFIRSVPYLYEEVDIVEGKILKQEQSINYFDYSEPVNREMQRSHAHFANSWLKEIWKKHKPINQAETNKPEY